MSVQAVQGVQEEKVVESVFFCSRRFQCMDCVDGLDCKKMVGESMGVLVFAMEDGLDPKKVASTKRGEYNSPCPGCGGKDRFIIWDKLNRYWCRQCNRKGDEIQYCRDFHGLSYVEACRKIGIAPKDRSSTRIPLLQEKRPTSQFQPQVVKKPLVEWRSQAESFTRYCHEQVKHDPFALDLFLRRGLSEESIERFYLGWNPSSLWLNRSHWGLETEERRLWIPKGLVIPTYDRSIGGVIKLKIRRSDWQVGDKLPKYVEISGSMQTPSVYGDPKGRPIVVVESEIDAILLQQCAGDLCCSMALGGASKRPDVEGHKLLLDAPAIVFSLDVDSAGAIAYRWWKKVYLRVKLCPPPIGKSPGDAFLAGIDLREWIGMALSLTL